MDVLSDVLQAVRLKGALYFDVRAAEPVIAETPPMRDIGRMVMPEAEHVISFHIMLRGNCWVETFGSEDPPTELNAGDIVVFPHGHGHAFVSELGQRNPPNLCTYSEARGMPLPVMIELEEQQPEGMRFVCGYFGCSATPFNPLLSALPSRILARRPARGNHIEVDLIHAAVEEAGSARAGSETILARLSELLFVRVVRRHIESLPEESRGWLAGLRDLHIGKALEHIHGEPARDWTVESLARASGMSRASFAERFADHLSETPMRYLAKWRMQIAAALLEQPDLPIEAIAEQIGYKSESAFNRAFRNIVGVPPGAWRTGQRAAADDRIVSLRTRAERHFSAATISDDRQRHSDAVKWAGRPG